MTALEPPGGTRAVVIGVGNPFRGDDGVGLRVAELIESQVGAAAVASPPIEVVLSDGEASRLVDTWTGAGRVVVVDAVVTGAAPGTVGVWEAGRQPLPFRAATSTHASGVAEAWALGEALGNLPGRLLVVGVEGACFVEATELSRPVERAVPAAARLALAAVTADGDDLPDLIAALRPSAESGSFGPAAGVVPTASLEP